jgi:hypothetical protein
LCWSYWSSLSTFIFIMSCIGDEASSSDRCWYHQCLGIIWRLLHLLKRLNVVL